MMIEVATIADVSEINVLVNSAYRGDSSRQGWTTEADLLDGIRTDEQSLEATFRKIEVTILKYVEDHSIQGIVSLTTKDDHIYLGMLTVLPTLQAKGIGKKLLAGAEAFTKSVQKTKIRMTVISVRAELIAWYERHGYIKTGETEPFPMNDPDFGLPKQHLEFIVMEKQL